MTWATSPPTVVLIARTTFLLQQDRQTDRQTDRQPQQPATFFLSLTTVASEFEPAVAKLLSKMWWIPIGARLEGLKLEPEGPGAEGGVPDRRPGVFEHSRLLWQLNSV